MVWSTILGDLRHWLIKELGLDDAAVSVGKRDLWEWRWTIAGADANMLRAVEDWLRNRTPACSVHTVVAVPIAAKEDKTMARGHEQGEQLRRELAAHLNIDRNRVGHEWSPGGGRCVTVLAATAEELGVATMYLRGRDAVWRLDNGAGLYHRIDGTRRDGFDGISFQVATHSCPVCDRPTRRTDHDRGHEMRIDRTCMNQNCKRVGKPWSELIQKRPAMPERRAPVCVDQHEPHEGRMPAVGRRPGPPKSPPVPGREPGALSLQIPGEHPVDDFDAFHFNGKCAPKRMQCEHHVDGRCQASDGNPGPPPCDGCGGDYTAGQEPRQQPDPWSTYPDGPVDGMMVVAIDAEDGRRGVVTRGNGRMFVRYDDEREDMDRVYPYETYPERSTLEKHPVVSWHRPLKPARVEQGQAWLHSIGSTYTVRGIDGMGRVTIGRRGEPNEWKISGDASGMLTSDEWIWVPGGES